MIDIKAKGNNEYIEKVIQYLLQFSKVFFSVKPLS